MTYRHSTEPKSLRSISNLLYFPWEKFAGRNYSVDCTVDTREIDLFFQNLQPWNTGYELIRIGGSGDGSYLIPNDLENLKLVVSPGFGGMMEFEQDLWKRNIPSIILDKNVPEASTDGVRFIANFVKPTTDKDRQEISLGDLVSEHGFGKSIHDSLLQMDIEADEWLVLPAVEREVLTSFRIMVIEFHSLPLMRHPWIMSRVMAPTMSRILRDFTVVHLNVNYGSGFWTINGADWYPDTIELTFHRKDRIIRPLTESLLPHHLEVFGATTKYFSIRDFFPKVSERLASDHK